MRINNGSEIHYKIMKQLLLYFLATLCAVTVVNADESIRSLQRTLKDQGFYYGAVTGEKSAETTAAIRRYQIRNGLPVTGELNEETLRTVKPSSNSVAAKSEMKHSATQPDSDVNARVGDSSPPPSFSQPVPALEANPSYSASFYQSAPVRTNRRIIAAAQYRLMSAGYYRGRVDGRNGRATTFAVRAFQSSAGLPPTGRLDMQTLQALGSSGADLAYLAPTSRRDETWTPVRKFKHGRWKIKWKKHQRDRDSIPGDEDQQANSDYGPPDYPLSPQ